MGKKVRGMRPEVLMFFILVAAVALGNGLSDGIYSNYFKDVYQVSAFQRGLIEFPRELPGLLCVFVIGLLGFMGDLRISLVAQLLAMAGVTILGLLTPAFGIMLIFLFINSLGMHLFMPLQESIGMSLAEPNRLGQHMGRYSSIRAAFAMIASAMVFFGFRTGFFTFNAPVKLVFLFAAVAFAFASVMLLAIIKKAGPVKKASRKDKFIIRKEFRYFYMLTVLSGVQKQIAYVYGTWVIVDLLMKKADTLALLSIAVGFVSIIFLNILGRAMDRFGIKIMMYADAISFIAVYLIYGFMVWGITSGKFPTHGLGVLAVYILFITDRLSMQMGMVRAIYLRSISWNHEEVTSTLSMGISLDHVVSILAAIAGGFVWSKWGSQWVFFFAAAISLGNLYVAYRIQPEKEKAAAEAKRAEMERVAEKERAAERAKGVGEVAEALQGLERILVCPESLQK